MGLRETMQDNELYIFIGKVTKKRQRGILRELGGGDTLSANNLHP